jgi:hypothetical protein
MFWDDLVRRWRKSNKANSPRLLRAAGGHVAVLPSPQRARQVRPLLVILAILALLLLLLFRSGRIEMVPNTTEPTQPTSVLVSSERLPA